MLIIAQTTPADFPFEEAFVEEPRRKPMQAPPPPAIPSEEVAQPVAPASLPPDMPPAMPDEPPEMVELAPEPDPITPVVTAPKEPGDEGMAPAPGRLPSMVGEQPQDKVSPPGPGVPEDPAKMFEEVIPPETPVQEKNRIMDVRQKVAFSLGNNIPIKITYTTLPKQDNAAGSTTQRVIVPDYVYWAGTGRHVVVAWDNSKNDWRAFALERINGADLLDEMAA
jgi:hypothetical protein